MVGTFFIYSVMSEKYTMLSDSEVVETSSISFDSIMELLDEEEEAQAKDDYEARYREFMRKYGY